MIAAFDELILKCSDENTRVHIREAVHCYNSGAYRAAIITAYIAVCFDLIEKLRALAATGDGAASQHLNKLETMQDQRDNGNLQAISGLLEFERALLEVFRDDFDFFGVNEFEELSRLRDDRNRCAHPSFFKSTLPYNPSAELARLHIRNALVLVLTQEPKQGRAALSDLQAVVLSKYFPDSVEDAAERLKVGGLSNARDALHRAFVDSLLFGVPDAASPYYRKYGDARRALLAAIEIKREVVLPRAVTDTGKLLRRPEDEAIRFGALIALQVREVGNGLDETGKELLRQWVRKESGPHVANVLHYAMELDWLADEAKALIPSLEAENFVRVSAAAPNEIVSRAAHLYASVNSWNEAGRVGDRCAMPFAGRFSESDLRLIFSSTAEGSNDLKTSGHFKRFVRAVHRQNPLGREAVDALLSEYELEMAEDEGVGD